MSSLECALHPGKLTHTSLTLKHFQLTPSPVSQSCRWSVCEWERLLKQKLISYWNHHTQWIQLDNATDGSCLYRDYSALHKTQQLIHTTGITLKEGNSSDALTKVIEWKKLSNTSSNFLVLPTTVSIPDSWAKAHPSTLLSSPRGL